MLRLGDGLVLTLVPGMRVLTSHERQDAQVNASDTMVGKTRDAGQIATSTLLQILATTESMALILDAGHERGTLARNELMARRRGALAALRA